MKNSPSRETTLALSCSCFTSYFRPNVDNGGGLWLNYSRLKSLPSQEKLCDFHCSTIRRIFAKRNFIDSLSESDVKRFCNLTELYMPSNCLGALPANIGYLRSLVTLNLDGNRISLLPNSISNLISLNNLILRDNLLEKLPNDLGNLSNLKFVDLSINKFSTFPKSILQCRNLKKIWISKNRLLYLPTEISIHKTIEEVNVSYNSLIYLPADLGRSEKLRSIRISENRLLNTIPGAMSNKLGFCVGVATIPSLAGLQTHLGLKAIEFTSDDFGKVLVLQPHGVVKAESHIHGDYIPSLEEIVLRFITKQHGLRKNVLSRLRPINSIVHNIVSQPPLAHCRHCDEALFKYRLAAHAGVVPVFPSNNHHVHIIDYYCSNSCVLAVKNKTP